MAKIKRGDTVLIISGKDRGKKGKILHIFPKLSKILVEGINLKKKHRRARKAGEKGQIISLPTPLYIFRVKLICPKCSKLTKVKYVIRDGRKYRVCKNCALEI